MAPSPSEITPAEPLGTALKLTRHQMRDLASRLAAHVFHRVVTGGGTVQRIQFKGGKYPDNETNMGGLCESALACELMAGIERACEEAEEAEKSEFIVKNRRRATHDRRPQIT